MLLITPTMDSQIRKSDAKKFLHDKASASHHDLNFSDDEDPAGDNPVGEDGTRRRPSSGGKRAGAAPPSCQAERCAAVLVDAKRYHRRHKVCEFHAKAPVVIVAGLRQRFCQQCSRFHEVSEFDEAKRSCRRRLAGHNERRRKVSTPEAPGAEGTSDGSPQGDQMKESKCRAATDERGSSAAYSHFQIR